MHTFLNRLLLNEITRDQQLGPASKLLYIRMRSHRKSTIKEYAAAFGMPYQTIRRYIRQLERCDWVYSFKRTGSKESTYVPWMPLDIETALARRAEWLADIMANRGERLMKALLDIIVDDDDCVDNVRPKWTVLSAGDNPLEFDTQYLDANVALEFQGRQHYEVVTFRDGKSNLREQQNRDGIKALACLRQGVTLVEIPDIELSYDTLVAKLEHLLPLLPPPTDRPLFRTLSNLCHEHATWAKSMRGK